MSKKAEQKINWMNLLFFPFRRRSAPFILWLWENVCVCVDECECECVRLCAKFNSTQHFRDWVSNFRFIYSITKPLLPPPPPLNKFSFRSRIHFSSHSPGSGVFHSSTSLCAAKYAVTSRRDRIVCVCILQNKWIERKKCERASKRACTPREALAWLNAIDFFFYSSTISGWRASADQLLSFGALPRWCWCCNFNDVFVELPFRDREVCQCTIVYSTLFAREIMEKLYSTALYRPRPDSYIRTHTSKTYSYKMWFGEWKFIRRQHDGNWSSCAR